MAVRSLNERVEILEQKVGDLQLLPDRVAAVESQILQLRGEMRDGFSAILTRMQEGDEESRRHARVLHEEVISRLALLHDLSVGLSAEARAKAEASAKAEGRGRRRR